MALAKPHYDESIVPKVSRHYFELETQVSPEGLPPEPMSRQILDVVRVRIDWNEERDDYQLGNVTVEGSGTEGVLLRSGREDALGSFKARLVTATAGRVLSHDSIATGAHFRKLTRALSFRFPKPSEDVRIQVLGEDHVTGEMRLIIDQELTIPTAVKLPSKANFPEVRVLKAAERQPVLLMSIYADGYLASRRDVFFQDAARAVEAVLESKVDHFKHVEFRAVFMPSRKTLGRAEDLGLPVLPRDSALGLYYPYWDNFGRWYHVVYPTSEEKFRSAVGLVPYDYILVLIDSSEYWGVGNYREFTAVPSRSSSFKYLVQHELGHYFGLNEEYNGGGPTELAFAPQIKEPWSQNITFLTDRSRIKWAAHIANGTQVPTPHSAWNGSAPYGAYTGGYAETEPFDASHIPGLSCTMDRADRFCAICKEAISARIQFDLGK
jgi:hypothetical protein